MSNELTTQVAPADVAFTINGFEPTCMEQAWRVAKMFSASGMAPRGLERPEALIVAFQYGRELGLSLMNSVTSIAVVNGRPTVYGDAMLALCRRSKEWDESGFEESFEGSPYKDDFCAVCRVLRRGGKPREERFSVDDAKRAQLWGKSGPWTTSPKRMLRFRARSFALRDTFGDVLKGIGMYEEVIDIPPENVVSRIVPAVDAAPTGPPPMPSLADRALGRGNVNDAPSRDATFAPHEFSDDEVNSMIEAGIIRVDNEMPLDEIAAQAEAMVDAEVAEVEQRDEPEPEKPKRGKRKLAEMDNGTERCGVLRKFAEDNGIGSIYEDLMAAELEKHSGCNTWADLPLAAHESVGKEMRAHLKRKERADG